MPCTLLFRDHCSASFALPVLREDGFFIGGLAEGDAVPFSLVEAVFDGSLTYRVIHLPPVRSFGSCAKASSKSDITEPSHTKPFGSLQFRDIRSFLF